MTYAEFCTKHGIQLVATRTTRNPHMEEPPKADARRRALNAGMAHWHVMLTYAAPEPGSEFCALRSMKLHFSKGSGHNGAPPTAGEVVGSLAMDARIFGHDGRACTFAQWCDELGMNSDSISDLRVFQASQSLTKRLREMVGPALFMELLSDEVEE